MITKNNSLLVMAFFAFDCCLYADPIELAESWHSYKELENAHSAAYGAASDDEREKVFLSNEELESIQAMAKSETVAETEKTKSELTKKKLFQEKRRVFKANALKSKEDQVKLVYEMFDKTPDLPEIIPAKRASIQTNSFIDAKFFLGDPGSTLNSIHGILFGPTMTRTVAGPAVAAAKLANPSSQVCDIIANQKRISFLHDNSQKFEQIDHVLEQIGASEQVWLNLSFRKTRSEFLSGLAQQNGKIKPNKKQLLQSKKYFDSGDWTWDPEKGNALTQPVRSLMSGLTKNSEFGTLLLGNPKLVASGLIPLITLASLIGIPTVIYRKGPKVKKGIFQAWKNVYNKEWLFKKNPAFKDAFAQLGMDELLDDMFAQMTEIIGSCEEFVDGLFSRKRLIELAKAHPAVACNIAFCGIPLLAFCGFCGFIILKENLSVFSNFKNTLSGILDAQKTLCEMRKLKDQMKILCTLVDPGIFPEIIELKKFVDCKTLDSEFDHLLKQLDMNTFSYSSSIFSRHGRTIQAFIALEKLKDRFAPAMKIVGQIDCMMAVVKNIKKTKGLANGFCLPEIVESEQTIFEITGMWNLFVGPENSIPNNLFLGAGSPDGIYGAVVSGPNFGGKTVYILGTFSAAVLVQCFGFAPAKSMRFAPFDGFVTYVKVSDNPPIDSLFSAQCRKMRELFDLAWKSKEDGLKVFIIADELLTGTKVTYAESLVRSAIREFSSLGGCVYLFATHFPAVTGNLEPDSHGRFKNMQVCANLDSEGFFDSPTFKVSDGESHTDAAFKVAASRFGEKYQHIIDNAKPLVLEQMSKKDKTRAMA